MILRVRQEDEKSVNALLRLDIHVADVDESYMLVSRACQQAVRPIACLVYAIDISRREESGQCDVDQVTWHIDSDGEERLHEAGIPRKYCDFLASAT